MVNLDKSFWQGKRVLITGHTGFKGSWLMLYLLNLGAKIWGYSLEPETEKSLFKQLNLENELSFNKINSYKSLYSDVRDLKRLRNFVNDCQPEIVFHLAAQSIVLKSYTHPLETWEVNVQGTLNLLETLKSVKNFCSVIVVTTDKVYKNKSWDFGYRENDELGGYDPYSSSKAAAEIAVSSWRSSFCGKESFQTSNLGIATVRAGNVIGGGDWAQDRIIPDCIKSITNKKPVNIRSPKSTRPWQHVLEPISGYLMLAQKIFEINSFENSYTSSFNFGPQQKDNRSVLDMVNEVFKYWPGEYIISSNKNAKYESKKLTLNIEKTNNLLKWYPKWSFEFAIEKTVNWYKNFNEGKSAISCCKSDLISFEEFKIGN